MKYLFLFSLLMTSLTGVKGQLELFYDQELVETVHYKDFMTILDEPYVDYDLVDEFIKMLSKEWYEPPVNAKLDHYGAIIPERLGYRLSEQTFRTKFYKYLIEQRPNKMKIPLTPLYPKVDSELLANIREKLIGHYVTYFNPRKQGRAKNIELAVEAINNTVVFPGETFSFNQVVGKRTIDKGYLPAPIIIRGKFYDGIGGGICQVSSTLFNAVDTFGVEIVQRFSHSRTVRYVPPGRDATVSWNGPDFVFKNNFNQPLLLTAYVFGGMVVVKVYSSDVINIENNQLSR